MAMTISDTFHDIYEKEYEGLITKPSSFANKKFVSTFGMSEMEWAAERIVEKCIENNDSWITEFYLSDFDHADRQNKDWLQTGFLCLIHNDWLKSGVYNGGFLVQRKFIERLISKHL